MFLQDRSERAGGEAGAHTRQIRALFFARSVSIRHYLSRPSSCTQPPPALLFLTRARDLHSLRRRRRKGKKKMKLGLPRCCRCCFVAVPALDWLLPVVTRDGLPLLSVDHRATTITKATSHATRYGSHKANSTRVQQGMS